MPTNDRIGVHDDRGGAPLSPGVREQHPKQAVSGAEWGTLRRAFEHCQLLTQREILERDRPVSLAAQPQGFEGRRRAQST
jgi:hypothetical protein